MQSSHSQTYCRQFGDTQPHRSEVFEQPACNLPSPILSAFPWSNGVRCDNESSRHLHPGLTRQKGDRGLAFYSDVESGMAFSGPRNTVNLEPGFHFSLTHEVDHAFDEDRILNSLDRPVVAMQIRKFWPQSRPGRPHDPQQQDLVIGRRCDIFKRCLTVSQSPRRIQVLFCQVKSGGVTTRLRDVINADLTNRKRKVNSQFATCLASSFDSLQYNISHRRLVFFQNRHCSPI